MDADELEAQFLARRQQNAVSTPAPAPEPLPREPERSMMARAQASTPRKPNLRALPSPSVVSTVANAPEIEKAVAAALYQYPNQCLPRFIDRGMPEFFFDPILHQFFQLLLDYYGQHRHADPNAFLQHLIDVGQLDKLGGPHFVTRLLHEVSPPGEAFDYHLDILRDKYVARQSQALGRMLSEKVATLDGDELWTAITEHETAMTALRSLAADKLEGVEDFAYADLVGFKADADPSVLLGSRRWLGRGYTSLWAGGSGYGKSTLQMQLALYWAAGTSCFGIRPVRPLKSLIIQAENDLGDTSEQFQGVLAGIKATGDVALNGQVERMITIVRLIGATGEKFLSTLESLLKLHKPDMVWIDPLFAFAGCDLVDTASVSHFLRDGLIPVIVRHQVCAHVIHHIAKPARDNDAKKTWSSHDYQFLGFGSSEIQNAFRAVNVLIPVSGHDGVFKLVLSKRGTRAGAKDVHGQFTTNLFLKHSDDGAMLWQQVDDPLDEGAESGGHRKFLAQDILKHMSAIDGYKTGALQKRISEETGMSRKTFYRLWDEVQSAEKVKLDRDGKWVLKPQSERSKS